MDVLGLSPRFSKLILIKQENEMYNLYATDKELEKGGVWYEPTPDFRVKLRRAGGGNKKYSVMLERLTKPYRRAIQADAMDSTIADSIVIKAFASAVVASWEVKENGEWVQGIANPQDPEQIMEFSAENVISVFEQFNDLFLDVKNMAESTSAFREVEREESLGNSVNS